MARTYRATFECVFSGGILIEPSLHYQTDVPTGGDEPDPSDVASGIWTSVGTVFRAITSDYIQINDLVVTEQTIPPALGVAGVHHVGLPGLLAHGGNDLPTGLCPVVNIHSGTRSRSARGWMHPGPPVDHPNCDGNQWATTYQTLLDNFAAQLNATFSLGSLFPTTVNPVVYSRTRHLRLETPYTFQVTGATANKTPKWLRSRMTTP